MESLPVDDILSTDKQVDELVHEGVLSPRMAACGHLVLRLIILGLAFATVVRVYISH